VSKRLLISDNGVTQTWANITDDVEMVVETTQNVSPILDQNQALQTTEFNRKGNMWPVASVPLIVMQQWKREFEATRGVSYYQADPVERQAFIARKLNDRDYQRFRTGEFKL